MVPEGLSRPFWRAGNGGMGAFVPPWPSPRKAAACPGYRRGRPDDVTDLRVAEDLIWSASLLVFVPLRDLSESTHHGIVLAVLQSSCHHSPRARVAIVVRHPQRVQVPRPEQ